MPSAELGHSDKPDRKHVQLERYLAFGFGVLFICTMLAISILIPDPSSFQYKVFLVVLSLAAAGFATTIPGFLVIEVNKYIKAGGAIAVFLISYYSSPAYLNIITGNEGWKRQSVSYSTNQPDGFRIHVFSRGNINVLENSMKIYASEVELSYPKAINGVQTDFVDKLVVTLNCEEDTPTSRVSRFKQKSNAFEIDREISVGETITLRNIDFEIPRTENIKLAECNTQFTLYSGSKQNGSGFVWGATAPGLFE